MKTTRWTSFAIFLLGLWQLSAPVTFGYSSHYLMASDLLTGALLIGFGIYLRREPKVWAYWMVALIGVWLQIAPLVFWAPQAACYVSNTMVGILAILFSIILPPLGAPVSKDLRAIPPGWSYNPSSWPQRMPIVFLATVGWLISRYLAAYQLHYIDEMWDPIFFSGSLKVLTSSISEAFPISDAGLCAVVYTLEALLACKGGEARWRTMPWMVVLFGLLVVPLGLVSVVLIILQPLVVGAWCSWCLATAGCMIVMVALAVDEVGAVLQLLCRAKSSFWKVFWHGDNHKNGTVDKRTPASDAPFKRLFAAMTCGVTPTWRLTLTLCLGILLMIFPASFFMENELADADRILGALIIVVSVISMAEIIRSWRYANVVFGVTLLAMLCRGDEVSHFVFAAHFVFLLLVIMLSLPHGKLEESC